MSAKPSRAKGGPGPAAPLELEAAPVAPAPAYAASLDALASSIGLPGETLSMLSRAGKGPPIFKIGRRIYCRVRDFHHWLDRLADGKIDAALSETKRRPPR